MKPLNNISTHHPLSKHQQKTPGHILKEAIEDLEWPGGPVTVHLIHNPQTAHLAARGPNGTLQVKLPLNSNRTQLRLHGQEVRHQYSYRHLATALGNVAREYQQHVTSKVGVCLFGKVCVRERVCGAAYVCKYCTTPPFGYRPSHRCLLTVMVSCEYNTC